MQSRVPSPIVYWHKMIWFKEEIPKCSFISWLVLLSRLPTRDRLARWGMNVSENCVFCYTALESHDHLFFSCPFSAQIWSRFTATLWPNQPLDIPSITTAILSLHHPTASVLKLLLQVSIYLIWKERNARIFNTVSSSSTAIISAVDRMIRDRLLSFPPSDPSSPSLLEVFFSLY
uniref:Reverse transcriptase zinc-binding domain-containing protein n=1 Tax=Noccaea caerulescens TaxID=107243 RepID=A0A1J3GU57_NOCCA